MYHTTLQATPDYMVFGREMISNTPFIVGCKYIRLLKQNIIDKNNQLENKNLKRYTYIIQDKLLVHNKKENKYEEPYIGPYTIN